MFGRKDDVIRQDQKRDADVALPDDAFAALTAAKSNDNSQDSLQSDPALQGVQPEPAAPAPDLPFIPSNVVTGGGRSIDGISSGPTRSLADPFDLMAAHKRALEQKEEPMSADHKIPEHAQEDSAEQPAEQNEAETTEPKETPEQPAAKEQPDETPLFGYKPIENPHLFDDVPGAQASAPVLQGGTDLAEIKYAALEQLSPLVDKLELSPEDKFKTTMMLIQASDNQELIPIAYEAAKNIQDEKFRAQALLDVVNEINYFTRTNAESSHAAS